MKPLLNEKELTMSSLEIAELTGKTHRNVVRDIQKMLSELGIEGAQISAPFKMPSGQNTNIFNLPKVLTLTLVTGYSIKLRHKINTRWLELEEQNIPKTEAEILLGSIQILVKQEKRIEKLEHEKTVQNSINDQFATQLKKLEINTRNGVPTGFLSRAQAHRIHGLGLSREIFEQAVTSLEVETKKYIHTENDRSTQTFGWNEDQILPAITQFINASTQATKTQCESQILNGKRFRYTLPTVSSDI